nr:MAG TPA_asm: hypothetical protein [Caudoviricetes sp.]
MCRAGVALRKGFSIISSLVLSPLLESFQDVPAAMQ